LVASTVASEWRTHRPNVSFVEVLVAMTTVNLSSSDGRFDISVPADDAELIASMLLLLEVPRQGIVRSLERARAHACSRATVSAQAPRIDIVLAS
jgi:hypothetical protein